MKKYITEENDIDTRALLDRFKNSPSDIQLAIQFAKECFPNLDINSFGPGGYPNNNGVNCIKFKSQNPANSSNPIGYLCDSNGGKLVYLSQAEDDKKAKGITPVPAKDTKWSCSVLSQYKNAYSSPDLQNIYDALKTVFKPENIKDYTELTKTQALQQGFYLQSLDKIYTDNKQALDSIASDVNWQFKIANKPFYFWRKGTTVDLKQDISASIVSDMETIGATEGKCSTLEKDREKCFDIDLNVMYPGEFQGPKYYHYNATNAVDARTKLKSIRKETQDSYGKRDCKKVFKEYVDLIRTCGQGQSQTEINMYKPAVQACINTQRDKFPDEVRIIDNPIKGKYTTMSCTKEFRLNKNESHSRLKNIIRENLIKLSIRKGLI
jgi:hypothetical protein